MRETAEKNAEKLKVFNGMTTTHSYNDANLPSAESYSGGSLNGLTVTLGYDAYLRRNSVEANTSTEISQSFAYDTASRLQTVTDGAFSSTYGYHPNSRLINTITHAQSGAARLTETRATISSTAFRARLVDCGLWGTSVDF